MTCTNPLYYYTVRQNYMLFSPSVFSICSFDKVSNEQYIYVCLFSINKVRLSPDNHNIIHCIKYTMNSLKIIKLDS